MTMPFTSIVSPWHNDDYDSYVIGYVKDTMGGKRLIGIENQGDPGSNQKTWIKACVKAGCEVIVAACRSYGQTKEDACRIARRNGYEVVEVTTLFRHGGPVLPNGTDLRDAFADNIQSLIMECLK